MTRPRVPSRYVRIAEMTFPLIATGIARLALHASDFDREDRFAQPSQASEASEGPTQAGTGAVRADSEPAAAAHPADPAVREVTGVRMIAKVLCRFSEVLCRCGSGQKAQDCPCELGQK